MGGHPSHDVRFQHLWRGGGGSSRGYSQRGGSGEGVLALRSLEAPRTQGAACGEAADLKQGAKWRYTT